jgi:hypothetical protein
MGLRCLLGHDYGDTRIEREREERGDELVVTVTEVEECSRCGETRVVSENTEVTRRSEAAAPEPNSDETDSDAGADTRPTADRPMDDSSTGDTSSGGSATDSPSVDETVDVVIDEAESNDDFTGTPTARPDSEPSGVGGEPSGATASAGETDGPTQTDPSTDDAEIIDADDSAPATEPDRDPGEWPEEDATHPADTTVPDDDAEFVDADPVDESDAAADARRDVVEDVNPDGASTAPESEDTEIVDADAGATADDSVGRGSTADKPDETAPGRHDTAGHETGPGGTTDHETTDDSGWPSHDEDDDQGYDAEVGAGDDTGEVSVDGSLRPDVDPETVADEDVEFIESSPDPAPRDTNGASGSHETEQDAGFDGLPEDVAETAGSDTGASSGGSPDKSRPRVDLSTDQQDIDSEYFCPDCGHAESVGTSSMRKGDICPECMKGYIDERAVE